jgi:hypothetical protein
MSKSQITSDALFAAWPNATDEQKLAALAVLQGASTVPASAGPFPAILSPERAAELTNLTTRSLRSYARKGLLQRAYFCGSKRSWGYSAESVRQFIEGAVRRGAEVASC